MNRETPCLTLGTAVSDRYHNAPPTKMVAPAQTRSRHVPQGAGGWDCGDERLMPVFPVPIHRGKIPKISQGFGGSSGRHKGIDVMYRRKEKGVQKLPVFSKHYEMPSGIPALAFAAGKVTRASMIGTGGRVRIDHGNGLETAYYHLRKPAVRIGQIVKAGQPVGDVYHNTSPPSATRTPYKLNHLHFEIFKNGRNIDPKPLLDKSQIIEDPSRGALILKIGAVVVLGLIASRYVR